MKRQCICCGDVFEPFSSSIITCSPTCLDISVRRPYADVVLELKGSFNLKTCPECNTEFWWTSNKMKHRTYCSQKCADEAKRKRRKNNANKEKHN